MDRDKPTNAYISRELLSFASSVRLAVPKQ